MLLPQSRLFWYVFPTKKVHTPHDILWRIYENIETVNPLPVVLTKLLKPLEGRIYTFCQKLELINLKLPGDVSRLCKAQIKTCGFQNISFLQFSNI